jgi:hypothetical protein|tara:strand:- start:1864 stop:2028 length:165 start_codon:yes stop_codon:yes gene_type:complete
MTKIENLENEYLILCINFGSVEVESVMSLSMYCRQRKIYSSSQLYNNMEEIMSW